MNGVSEVQLATLDTMGLLTGVSLDLLMSGAFRTSDMLFHTAIPSRAEDLSHGQAKAVISYAGEIHGKMQAFLRNY